MRRTAQLKPWHILRWLRRWREGRSYRPERHYMRGSASKGGAAE